MKSDAIGTLKSAGTVFVVQAAPESGLGAVWSQIDRVLIFSSIETLVSSYLRRNPETIVFDLDHLPPTVEEKLEKLPECFPGTPLVLLCSGDSLALARKCVEWGYSDYLLKPLTADRLAWVIKNHRLHPTSKTSPVPERFDVVHWLGQIGNGATASLVKISTLEGLQSVFESAGAAWLGTEAANPSRLSRVISSVPRGETSQITVKDLLAGATDEVPTEMLKLQDDETGEWRLLIPMPGSEGEALLLWGIRTELTESQLQSARALLDECWVSLRRLLKIDELTQQAFVDDLTGLYNSRYLNFALTRAVLKCKGPREHFALLFIDVDHFKNINDTCGHLVGSQFLVAIAQTIRDAVRLEDIVFRYGGDEFVVLLNRAGMREARTIAERIRRRVETRIFEVKGGRIQTTVSIGVAAYPDHARGKEDLMRLADEAMYSAKQKSRNAVHLALGVGSAEPNSSRSRAKSAPGR